MVLKTNFRPQNYKKTSKNTKNTNFFLSYIFMNTDFTDSTDKSLVINPLNQFNLCSKRFRKIIFGYFVFFDVRKN